MTRAALLLALVAQGFSPAFAADKVPAAGGDITITPLIHSSIQIEHAGKVIQIDPWSALDLARYKKADLILITDDPIHHLDVKAIEALRKPGAPVVIPEAVKAKYPDGIIMANGEKRDRRRRHRRSDSGLRHHPGRAGASRRASPTAT